MGSQLESTDAKNKLEDLSGIVIKPGQNPYEAFISACEDNHIEIQKLYSVHRTKRNEQQKAKFHSDDFKELVIDPFLLRLERPDIDPGFKDHRNCLVFWARPPEHIIQLAVHLQNVLKSVAQNIWLMPPQCMHMTTLEVTHSRTPEEIACLVDTMRSAIPKITRYTYNHRSRLVKPMISYDLTAFAVSFLPASEEPIVSPATSDPSPSETVTSGDAYTYHHLRRDIFDLAQSTGVEVASRYQVPSAHITLGRYLGQEDHDSPEKRRQWTDAVDKLNEWLESEVWGRDDGGFCGEWIVGQERGLDARCGTLWYGGGRTINMGEGF